MATIQVPLTNTEYTELGAAPVQVQAIGGDISVIVGDALPAPEDAGFWLGQSGLLQTIAPGVAGDLVYARSQQASAIAAVTVLTT